ncbi:MAG TPA: hypothetical protein VD963_03450 [Phycisphaerales bacterium]|nr:hypothetical protein [Phycisphaerales bacterium]
MLDPNVDLDLFSRLLLRFCMPFGAGFIILIAGICGVTDPLEHTILPLAAMACGAGWMGASVWWVRREYAQAPGESA